MDRHPLSMHLSPVYANRCIDTPLTRGRRLMQPDVDGRSVTEATRSVTEASTCTETDASTCIDQE
jgi:hypothetical protein